MYVFNYSENKIWYHSWPLDNTNLKPGQMLSNKQYVIDPLQRIYIEWQQTSKWISNEDFRFVSCVLYHVSVWFLLLLTVRYMLYVLHGGRVRDLISLSCIALSYSHMQIFSYQYNFYHSASVAYISCFEFLHFLSLNCLPKSGGSLLTPNVSRGNSMDQNIRSY